MAQITYIDHSEIPLCDIVSSPVSKERITFNRNTLIAYTLDIVLNDIDGNYSTFAPTSAFYGSDFYNKPVEIFDEELNVYTFKGRIKDIQQNDGNGTIVVKATNYVRDLVDTKLELSSSSAITPAEHILNILTDVLDIEDVYIEYAGFQDAINIQDGVSVYADINSSLENSVTCLAAIEELCRITQSHIYTKNNLICLYQWREYAGNIGERIRKRHVKPGTFKSSFVDEVINGYKIAYKSGASAAYKSTDYTESLTANIRKFGQRTLNIPDENVDSTTATDFRILLQSSTAAKWCGNLAIDRCKNLLNKYDLGLDEDLSCLHINDQVDLNFDNFTNEPTQIEELTYDRNTGKFSVKGVFLNLPENRYTRDEDPPDPIELYAALPGNGRVLLKWTESQASDLAGYYVYLTSTKGEWFQEICHLGQSPIEEKSPSISADGYCYLELRELNPGTRYYFKVSAFDVRYNESAESNVMSCIPTESANNIYSLDGSVYHGLTLDEKNPFSGTAPSDFVTYADNVEYGTAVYGPAGVFESAENINFACFSFWKFKGVGNANNIKYSYRERVDGASWGTWSNEANAIGSHEIMLTKKFFQYRFIFYSPNWTDLDNIYVQELT